MRKFSNKKIVAVAVGAVALTGTGVAYAYWTTSGSGTGSASAGTNAALTNGGISFTQTGTPANLVLDGDPQPVKVTVSNLAGYAQAADVTATPTTYPQACGATNWTWTPAAPQFTGEMAALTGVSPELTLGTLELDNKPANQDGCKGASVSFTFTAATTTK